MSIKSLRAKHFRIVELSLAGWKSTDIATETGLVPESVARILRSPVFQGELARRRKEQTIRVDSVEADLRSPAAQILAEASSVAAQTQVGLLESESEKIQQTAAMDILDRTGIPKITKSQNQSISAQIILDNRGVEALSRATAEAFNQVLEFPLETKPDEPETHDQDRNSQTI